jgi:hypothetical protein
MVLLFVVVMTVSCGVLSVRVVGQELLCEASNFGPLPQSVSCDE